MSRSFRLLAVVLALVGAASVASADVFNEDEGRKALYAARIRASACSKVSGVTGSGKIKVTIGNNGQVSDMTMVSVPPTMDEKTDLCVRAEFQKIRVVPFEGAAVVVSGGFVLL